MRNARRKVILCGLIAAGMVCLLSTALHAQQGLFIPSTVEINVNTGTLCSNDDITLEGTLTTTTGWIRLHGDWINATGAYTPNMGTLDFKGTMTQTLDSSGIVSGKLFNNLYHTGTGTLNVVTNDLNIDNNFVNTAGTVDAGTQNITIEGDWNNTAAYDGGTGTVTFDGTSQSVLGSTTFNNFVKTVLLADTMIFDSTGTQTITGTLEMHGTLGQLLTITSDDDDADPTQWGINLRPGGFQVLNSLNVRLSDASDGLTLVAGVNSIDLGMNDNWVFGGATLTWTGSISTDWDVAGNWDLGLIPVSNDNVIIPAGTVNPLILNVDVAIVDVEVQAGATVQMDGQDFVLAGTLSNEGTITLFGNETLSIATPDTDSGTFIFLGDGNGGSVTYTLPDFGTVDFYNLVINDSNATMDNFDTSGTLTVNGTLSVTSSTLDTSANADTLQVGGNLVINGGTLTSTSSTVDLEGDLLLSSGVFTAPDVTGTFFIAGDFNHSTGGTFTNSGGVVVFDGLSQGITGDVDTTFATLSKTTLVPDTFTFSTSSEQTVTGTLQLEGTMGGVLSINSDSVGVQADLTLLPGGVQQLDWLSVTDNDASGGLLLAPMNSTEFIPATTTNWDFDGADVTWEGDESTDWQNPMNWDLGFVPGGNDHAIIPPVPTQPILTANVGIDQLTLNPGATTVMLEDYNLTVAGTLSNDGTITLFGNQMYSFGLSDNDSGLFIFLGDGDGTADTYLITDQGTFDFYNVIINDVNATMDSFRTTGSLNIAGTLTLSSGTVDNSTLMGIISIGGSLLIEGGQLLTTAGTLDVNGGVSVTTGTLSAPGPGYAFTVANDWTMSVGGTFVANGGQVEFDGGATASITGDTRFHDFFSDSAGKTFIFESGSEQTVEGSFILQGMSGTEIVLRPSAAAGQWFLDFTTSPQISQFVDVDYSTANTNIITCFNCIENTPASTVNWVFGLLSIDVPVTGETTDNTPTIIGTGSPGATVEIRDGANMLIGSAVADANANYRFEVTGTLPLGAITLTPFIGPAFGNSVLFTISAAPTTAEQPVITSPADGDRILGSMPTITGFGDPGEAVEVLANDANGNLLLASVGTGIVTAGGTFSVTLSSPLPKGTNFVSVTIGGVASDIFEFALTDPFGVVFDSIRNTPIVGAEVLLINETTGLPAVPGVDIDATDVNPVVTGTNGFYSFLTINDDFHLEVTAESYTFPSILDTFDPGREINTGSKGEVFTITGSVMQIDLPMDPAPDLLRIEKDANKREARIGDVITYTIKIENVGVIDAPDAYIHDRIPAGFKYIQNRVTLDGVPIANPRGNRPVVFDIGDVNVGQTKILKYQLVIGSGVVVGDYQNVAIARHVSGIQYSNPATEVVTVILDPLFDLGTTIGKVFYDRNENGVQDPPVYDPVQDKIITEEPVPNVRIVTEDGTVVVTDKEGRYNVPALLPGRHLFRVDERTLPEGTYLTTDKVVVVDITPGLMVKANFGIKEDSEIAATEDSVFFAKKVKVALDDAKPEPRLHVALFEDPVGVLNGIFVKPVEFRIFTNYAAFIHKWVLEIIDKDVGKVIHRIEGDQLNVFDPIYWDGRDLKGNYIDPNRNYEFRLMIEDKEGKFDETAAQSIEFEVMTNDLQREAYVQRQAEARLEYQAWSMKNMKQSSLTVQTILVDGQRVTIDRLGTRLKSVRVLHKGQLITEVPVTERHGLTAQEIVEGKDTRNIGRQEPLEVILPKGSYSLMVQEDVGSDLVQEDMVRVVEGYGEIREEYNRPVQTYSKPLRIGEDQLFFVAMGDARMGYTMTRGNVEPVLQSDRYNEGFYTEGKLAYYLKGKILGKYLVTSSFDTQRERKEIFRNLDPEEYYPIYGDGSQIDYEATNTQGNLYALVEWDKSSAIWGNYSIGFDKTDFGRFSRSLYGGKVDYESVSSTKYGDARTKVIAFRAKAQQRSAHVEFTATGGTLYYLKHKDVLEGSDKVTVEVRDKINGLVLATRDMVEGADYEMDYASGRMVFWRPVPSLVESYSIADDDLLDGNGVYVVVDYEYQAKDKVDEGTVGVRARQAVGENLLIGTTYVNEELEQSDYQLRGTDVTLKLGENAQITAEYAQTVAESQPNFVSTDGGLSFTELKTSEDARGKAYGLKGNAKLFNRFGIDAYFKYVDNEFSSSATTSQQGKELLGYKLTYDLGEKTRFTLSQDFQRLLEDGNDQTRLQVGSNRTTTTIAQLIHEARLLRLTAEYKRKEDEAAGTAVDIVAVRADFPINERLIFSFQQQATIGEGDWRTEIGVAAKPTDKLTVTFKEVFSEDGTATTIGLIADMNERFALTAGYTFEAAGDTSATLGAIAKVNERIQLETAFGVSSSKGFTRAVAIGANGSRQLGEDTSLDAVFGADETGVTTASAELSGTTEVTDQTSLKSTVKVTGDGTRRKTDVTVAGITEWDESTKLESEVGVSEASSGYRGTRLSIGGRKQIDEDTEVENKISFANSNTGLDETTVSFGSKKKLTDDVELTTSRIFGSTGESQSEESQYGISLVRDGKKLQGTLSRKFAQGVKEVSRTNVFGLTGEIDDRWAVTGRYEKGEVRNLDGTTTDRDVVSLAAGYVKKDKETGLEVFKSSSKLEVRFDEGTTDKRQFLVSNASEGQLTPEFSLFTKIEYSETVDTSLDTQIAQYKEFVIGGAYRPIMFDSLNVLGKYTYLENRSPASQEDNADIEEEKAHVFSTDLIYDVNDKWQVTEKFAMRASKEKVEGFDFTETLTWLMIHRLTYKVNRDWAVSGEYRMLTVREAEDKKQGFMLEVTRRVGEYAQLGVGYDFTDFTDDLTDLDYSTYGPFVRVTGKLYDRSPEEIERARQKWLEEKVARWAWIMVQDELTRDESPILRELNDYFVMAQLAYQKGDYEESRRIYKDIIVAGRMMHDEAAEFVRKNVRKEERLRQMKDLADQYYKNGQYEKAKKILEKILEEAKKPVIK
ncbi:MAG: DUF11 domain-containing protein [Candidatus Omnitrophica bacterium]|nr:DUF11 domain-containing protein [Candidatus Omnitrophota bacterium]